jgi:hypothetical protein
MRADGLYSKVSVRIREQAVDKAAQPFLFNRNAFGDVSRTLSRNSLF